jgi:hypothetical protein
MARFAGVFTHFPPSRSHFAGISTTVSFPRARSLAVLLRGVELCFWFLSGLIAEGVDTYHPGESYRPCSFAGSLLRGAELCSWFLSGLIAVGR